ncbi:MAG: translation initiation factor IF-5A [Candidatus Diapherotrites archaeon]
MSEKVFKEAGHLKEGNYMIVDGEPCKIKAIEKSKPGKHGAAKCRITVFGLFDDRKRQFLGPAGTDVEVPIVERSNAQVVAITDDTVQIMDMKSYEMISVKKPEDMADLQNGQAVEYLRYGDQATLVRTR